MHMRIAWIFEDCLRVSMRCVGAANLEPECLAAARRLASRPRALNTPRCSADMAKRLKTKCMQSKI